MTKGDIIQMPSGRLARYEGGSDNGAMFVYLSHNGQPATYRGALDTVCIDSVRLLAKLQPEAGRL